MITKLTQIDNSKGVLLDKAILKLIKMTDGDSFDISIVDNGLFLKPIKAKDMYKKRATKHRKSLNKLGE